MNLVDSLTVENLSIQIENGNLVISSVVSLLKAAHLSLFELFGYRYARSAGGYFIGRQVLGEFFLNNNQKAERASIENSAIKFFTEFKHLVRPVQKFNPNILGTISDNRLMVCRNPDKSIWAFIVFVKTSILLHAILLPVLNSDEAANTFIDFIHKENEQITVNWCIYDSTKDEWSINPDSINLYWPKHNIKF
jgi:hypothetical protein